jgi:hypothetical protein
LQGKSLFDPNLIGQPAIQTVNGTIEIGVSADNSDVITDRTPENLPDSIIRSQAFNGLKEQRVMGDQCLGSSIPGSLNRPKARIQGNHYTFQWLTGVAYLQADIVPIFCQLRSVKLMHKPDQILYALSLFSHFFLSVLPLTSRKKSAAWFFGCTLFNFVDLC